MSDVYANRTKKELHTELIDCAGLGDTDCVKAVLNYRVDINYNDSEGNSPIQSALKKHKWDTVDFLLKNNADIDNPDYEGNTPLLKLIAENNLKAVRYCLKHGADPNRKGERGTLPLILAAVKGSLSIVELLLQHGADPNLYNDSDPPWSALVASMGGLNYSFNGQVLRIPEESRTTIALRLIKAGTNPETIVDDITALQAAASAGWKQIVHLLLTNGADPNRMVAGKDALYMAVIAGQFEIAQQLLLAGADPNQRQQVDTNVPTTLGQAILKDNAKMVELLLYYGASMRNLSDNEDDAQTLASGNGSKLSLEIILNRKNATNKEDQNIRSNIQKKKSNNEKDPVINAASRGQSETLRILIEQGCNIDEADKNNGYTPLHWAAIAGCRECVDILIRHGANVNSKALDGSTPLIKAVQQKPETPEITDLLIKHGAKINYKMPRKNNKYLGGAAEQAFLMDNYDTLKVLLEAGIKLSNSKWEFSIGNFAASLNDPNNSSSITAEALNAIIEKNISKDTLELVLHHFRKDKHRRRISTLLSIALFVFISVGINSFVAGAAVAIIVRVLITKVFKNRKTTTIKPLPKRTQQKLSEIQSISEGSAT